MTVVHIAGMAVLIGDKGRQLCAWCGHVLFDFDLSMVMVAPNADGSPGRGPTPWTQGALVAVEGNGMWVVPDEGDTLPRNCCASPPAAPAKLTLVPGGP